MSKTVVDLRERLESASRKNVEELLEFSELAIPTRGEEETENAYIKRMGVFSAAKKKAIQDAFDILERLGSEKDDSEIPEDIGKTDFEKPEGRARK